MKEEIWQNLTTRLKMESQKDDRKNTHSLMRFWMQGTTFNSVNNYNDYTKDYCSSRKKNPQIKNVHFYFSSFLLRYVPKIRQNINATKMAILAKVVNFTKNSLANPAAITILEKSKKVFPNSFSCASSRNSIVYILRQMNSFVKYFENKILLPVNFTFRRMKKVVCPLFRSAAICVFSVTSAYSQETSALSAVTKTKIKEWFDILTIPMVRFTHHPEQSRGSEVEGLKHKDPKVRISAIQFLGKVHLER